MDEKQPDQHNSDIAWAVIDSGSRRIVGKVPLNLGPGDMCRIEEAVELDVSVTRLPAGPNGQTAALYAPSMIPIDLERGPITISALIHSIRYFSEMPDRGRSYEAQYCSLMDQIVEARARAAGLETAHSVPSGFMGPNGSFGGGPRGG